MIEPELSASTRRKPRRPYRRLHVDKNLEHLRAAGRVIAASLLLWSLPAACGARAAPSPMPQPGFDIENPQWKSRGEQDAIIASLAAQRVALIRFPLVATAGDDFSSIIGFTERAFKAGIRADVILSPVYTPGAALRPAVAGTAATWPMPGLSSADPLLFDRTYGQVLRKLDEDGVVLAGLELGNEINWPPFNGDLPVPGGGRTLSLHDLATTTVGRKVADGFRAYIATLKVLKGLRAGLSRNATTPIVMAGLAEVSPGSPPPADRDDDVDIATTIDFLRANGADGLVDAYGVHTYAADGVSPTAASKQRLKDYLDRYVLSRCGTAMGGKPCWITEWGATQPSGCPFLEGPLPGKVKAFLDVIRPDIQDGTIQAMFYADWADPAQRGLYRCGRLSTAGRVYLDYAGTDGPGAGAPSEPITPHRGTKR